MELFENLRHCEQFDFIPNLLAEALASSATDMIAFMRNMILKSEDVRHIPVFWARAFPELQQKRKDEIRQLYAYASPEICGNPHLSLCIRMLLSDFSDNPPEIFDDADDRDSVLSRPLGFQKYKARLHPRDPALLKSPHPDVIFRLCANPSVSSKDIVKIASSRSARRESLRIILASDRVRDYETRLALAFNPRFPPSDTVRIAFTLKSNDAEAVAAHSTYPQVRSFVEALREIRLRSFDSRQS